MTDYTWKPKGLPIKVQGVAIDPYLAFKHFVMPALGDPNWIEDSSKVTDTGMSKREWIGLIVHAIALMDLTGDDLRVAKMMDNDDGGLVRGENEAVYVEQTLATHRNKKHDTLLETVAERVEDKSSNGDSYAANMHLIVFCNMDGDLQEAELAKIVSEGRFNIVNIFGFNSKDRHYLSLLFDRDKTDAPIHRCAISETKLIEQANRSGGLVGTAFDASSVDNSFSVANMQAVPVAGSVGAIVGDAANPSVSITDTYFDQVQAGRSNCKGTGDATVTCNAVTDSEYFLGNDTNAPLATWNQVNLWNLHEEGQLPSFSIGQVICDDPATQSESTLLFGCDWGRQEHHKYSGNAVSRQVRYRVRNSSDPWVYQNWPTNTMKVLITGLTASTDYEVQFHTNWEVGSSDWEVATAWLSTGASVNLDTDGDGILDSIELNGPNYGDANGDSHGVDYNTGMDSQQANVTSFKNPLTNNYVVLQSDCTSNSAATIISESTTHNDSFYDYSAGLMSFTAFGCGTTATFTQYFYGNYDASKLIARKYNAASHSYTTIPGAVLSNITINSQKVLKIVYQIADNSPFDENPTVGTITDPSGPATLMVGAPNTGIASRRK